jgi:hypothetical protein
LEASVGLACPVGFAVTRRYAMMTPWEAGYDQSE